MLKEAIQSLLKDRNMMDQFMMGRLQLEGVPQMQQSALRDVMREKGAGTKQAYVLGWI